MFNHIRVVLVNPSHPGNIGATARAMKTMGLTRLYLVNPDYFPHEEATVRASGATDLLEQATVCSTLVEAIADCQWIFGTSARERSLSKTTLDVRQAGLQIAQESQAHEVAIVFGEERIGLTNQQMDRCHYQIRIPTEPDFSSLNLASAVQILCYEVRMAVINHNQVQQNANHEEYATTGQLESYFKHLETILYTTQFINPNQPKKLMSRLRRLYLRARPSVQEINILQGILTAVERKFG